MKVKELRTLRAESLRGLCVEHNWYTRGNSRDYENLLSFVNSKENLATEDILFIATDIVEHSELELTETCISNVCFEVARKCISYFVAD